MEVCAASDLLEKLIVSLKLFSVGLRADGKGQAEALIHRLLLIKQIHFEIEHHCVWL